jgi:CBS domain-containing protein
MKTVQDVLHTTGNHRWAIGPGASVYEALAMMAEKDIGALLVVEAEKLVGIVSERDYARKVVLKGRTSRETAVRDIMTHKVLVIAPGHTIEECMALMTLKRVRHLPVMDDDRMVGIISMRDVVKAIMLAQDFRIEQLEQYIRG